MANSSLRPWLFAVTAHCPFPNFLSVPLIQAVRAPLPGVFLNHFRAAVPAAHLPFDGPRGFCSGPRRLLARVFWRSCSCGVARLSLRCSGFRPRMAAPQAPWLFLFRRARRWAQFLPHFLLPLLFFLFSPPLAACLPPDLFPVPGFLAASFLCFFLFGFGSDSGAASVFPVWFCLLSRFVGFPAGCLFPWRS